MDILKSDHYGYQKKKRIMDIQKSNYGYPKFKLIFGYPKTHLRISLNEQI